MIFLKFLLILWIEDLNTSRKRPEGFNPFGGNNNEEDDDIEIIRDDLRARTSFDNGENLFEPKKDDDEDDLDAALISPMVRVFLIIVFFFLD